MCTLLIFITRLIMRSPFLTSQRCPLPGTWYRLFAESVGFEPTVTFATSVFWTAALSLSANSP